MKQGSFKKEIFIQSDPETVIDTIADYGNHHKIHPLIEKVDHNNLNLIPPFDEVNPTAEAVAAWIHQELAPRIAEASGGRAHLAAVRLWETPDACVTYTAE